MSRAGLDRRPAEVAQMFDSVAPRYDFTNDVLSVGQDRLWRRAVTKALAPRRGERILDLGAGTGSSTAPLARSGATALACDFSLGMLRQARGRGLPAVAGDAMRLPFADAAFDAVTVSFGLRNVVDPDAALTELARVCRPGGRLVLCEFSRPVVPVLRRGYVAYLSNVLPVLARVSADAESYTYLVDSILAWPSQQELAARVGAAGWRDVSWRNLSFGVVAVHLARRPASGAR